MTSFFNSLLCFCVNLALLCYVQGAGPAWPPAYTARGVIKASGVTEPFQAWYDNSVASSRIDYHHGNVKTYQLSGQGQYGAMFRVEAAPAGEVCFKTEGSQKHKIIPESLLPDLQNYTFSGKSLVSGEEAEVWQYSEHDAVMYLLWKEDSNHLGFKNIVPVRFEKMGTNPVTIEFEEFAAATDLPPSIFKIDKASSLECRLLQDVQEDAVYNFNPVKDFVGHETWHVDSAWRNFKRQYKKQYSAEDEATRKSIFQQRMRYIASRNRANLNYTLEANHMADYTEEELKSFTSCMYNNGHGGVFHHAEEEDLEYEEAMDEPLPERWDWRARGAVTPVKDQFMCGSCWSFGTTGAIEGAHFAKTGQLARLSEQALVDCSWGYNNNGCDGGLPPLALEWVEKYGIPTDYDYGPYIAQVDFCHMNKTKSPLKISGYRILKPKCVECMKKALVRNGPLAVGTSVVPDFMYYKNGIFDSPECNEKPVGHAVLIVGYDSLDGKEYWIVKNSWSIYWGMSGYMLMAIEGDMCHLSSFISVVVKA